MPGKKSYKNGTAKRALVLWGIVAILSPGSATLAQQHIRDRDRDAPFWSQSADCPGPEQKSIFYRNSMGTQSRVCVDTRSIVRLPNGGRARFVSVFYYPGSGFTGFTSKWYQVDCQKGLWDMSSGYSVQNTSSDSYFPVSERPGWYEFIWEGKRPTYMNIGKGYWHNMTRVGPEERFFCPNL